MKKLNKKWLVVIISIFSVILCVVLIFLKKDSNKDSNKGKITEDDLYIIGVKINTYSEDELVEMVKNEDEVANANFVIQSYSDFYVTKTNKGNLKFRELLFDDSIDNSIKSYIILSMEFDDKDGKEILKDIASDDKYDSKLAYRAIKQLEDIDITYVRNLSDTILDDYKNYSDDKVRIALQIKSREYRENKEESGQDKEEFINICNELIEESTYKGSLGEVAIVALIDIGDTDVLYEIIYNSKIDNSWKVSAVDQNVFALLELLEDDKSEENINFICDAMLIMPLKEFYEPLKELSQSGDYNSETMEKIGKAMKCIENEGINVNKKYLYD